MSKRRPKRKSSRKFRDNGLPSHIRIEVVKQPSELEQKLKAAGMRFLEHVEKNPDAVVNAFGRLAESAKAAHEFVKRNPNEAKKKAGSVLLALLAGFARKELGTAGESNS